MTNFMRKTKIRLTDITYGPNTQEVDDLLVFTTAGELVKQGYCGVSNAYCHIARPDKEDWVVELARQLHRAPADFYVPGEFKVAEHWQDHYNRVYTKDVHTVHPRVYDAMKKMRGY